MNLTNYTQLHFKDMLQLQLLGHDEEFSFRHVTGRTLHDLLVALCNN